MKLRWITLLFAGVALLSLPVIGIAIGTAEEEAAEEAKKEKCCEKADGDKAECCSKGEKSCEEGAECCSNGEKSCEEGAKCCKKGDQTVAVKLDGIKCPISGHDIKKDSTVDHAGAKIYLCCDGCLDTLKEDLADDGKKKYLAKVNYQLVATGQAKQKGCPMSGGKVKVDTQLKVGVNEVEIGFCCKNCTKKADSKEGDDLLAMIFGEKAFAKAFTVGDEKEKEAK